VCVCLSRPVCPQNLLNISVEHKKFPFSRAAVLADVPWYVRGLLLEWSFNSDEGFIVVEVVVIMSINNN